MRNQSPARNGLAETRLGINLMQVNVTACGSAIFPISQGGFPTERLVCALTFLVLLATGSPSYAQVGDGQNGFALAQDNCSDCHAIRGGQLRSPNSRSPTFSELANTPGMTAIALTVALTTSHAGMPMFMLTANQRAEIIAYILSLR